MWWNQAFEAAGFRNAFKVEVLPEGADPMDIRYNMINWVHRSTRGWSSGGSVADPRTGEIIKATVTLGSLRDRQDYMIFEGLLSPYETGTERPSILYETALARIRQLSAHEVGHTLGLGHNYYDSSKGWISVMDYPASARGAEGGRHDRSVEGLRSAHRRLGQGGHQLRLPPVRRRHRRRRGAHEDHRRRVGAGPALLHQPGHRHPPAHRAVVERREPGRRAEPADEGAPGGARPHRREDDPHGRGHGDDRRAARADLHVSPLRGGERVVDDRRPGLRLRHARRRPHAGEVGDRGESAQGARGAGRHAEAVGADGAEEDPRRDSAASARLRAAPRAVPAHHRRGLRPAQPRHDCRGRHHRLRAAARPRRAHGGAARRRPDAARPGRSDRPLHQGHLRRADRVALRGRSAARRRARARRPRAVAGHVGARTARCARSRR